MASTVINKIKLVSVLKIKKHIYFYSDLPKYKELNSVMHRGIIKLMLSAIRNNSFETLLIIECHKFRSKAFTSNDNNNVEIPEHITRKLNDSVDTTEFIMMHNHPDNGGFSILDLHTFFIKTKN